MQWDSGHLSIPYSRSLAWAFAQRMQEALAVDGVTVQEEPAPPQLR